MLCRAVAVGLQIWIPLSPYEVLNGLYHGEYLRGLTSYVSNDKDAIKVLGQNSRGKNQMRVIKYICILKEIKNLNDYVKDTSYSYNRLLRIYGQF